MFTSLGKQIKSEVQLNTRIMQQMYKVDDDDSGRMRVKCYNWQYSILISYSIVPKQKYNTYHAYRNFTNCQFVEMSLLS